MLIVYGADQGVDADGQSLRDSAGIVEAVCISVDPQASPGRERYTGGVCRAYRKVYRRDMQGIQKGIQGGGGKINSQ